MTKRVTISDLCAILDIDPLLGAQRLNTMADTIITLSKRLDGAAQYCKQLEARIAKLEAPRAKRAKHTPGPGMAAALDRTAEHDASRRTNH